MNLRLPSIFLFLTKNLDGSIECFSVIASWPVSLAHLYQIPVRLVAISTELGTSLDSLLHCIVYPGYQFIMLDVVI